MGKFEFPQIVHNMGSLDFIEGPDGTRLGDGYQRYEALSELDHDGEEATMLVGVRGAARVILSARTYKPLVGSLEANSPDGNYWDYRIEDGSLYGVILDVTTHLGNWPPVD